MTLAEAACARRIQSLQTRLAAARELSARSFENERYFDWTAGHAPTAIERVHAGELAAEWLRRAARDQQTALELEVELKAEENTLRDYADK